MRAIASALAIILATNPAYATSAPPAAPPATTALSRAVQQGYDEGFHDCAKALDTWVRFVHTNDDAYSLFGRWSKDRPNDRTFTTLTAEGDGSINSFSATKNGDGTCDVVVTQIVPSQDPCSKLKDGPFKDWKYYGDLHTASIYEDPTSPNDNVVMVNTPGNGCLLTKQIVGFGIPK